jgi:hypothetical protein
MTKTPDGRAGKPASPQTTSADPNFTENKGNTIKVSGPIPVAPTPPAQPAMPPTESKKSES